MAARPWEDEGYLLNNSKTYAGAEILFRPAGRKTPHPALRADLDPLRGSSRQGERLLMQWQRR